MLDGLKVSFLTRLRNYFLAGVLVTAPLAITAYLAYSFISFVDTRVKSLIPDAYNPEYVLPFSVPGLGLVLIILFVVLIGFLTANFFGRALMSFFEKILSRTPVIRTVYLSLKQIFETVLSQQSNAFREAVLVEFPRKGIWMLGFVTGKTKGVVQEVTADEVMNVFVPTTPNPTSGFLAFFPKKDLIFLDVKVEDAFKMLISSGIVTPQEMKSNLAKPVKKSAPARAVKPAPRPKTSRKRQPASK